jgi:hypothetical protein
MRQAAFRRAAGLQRLSKNVEDGNDSLPWRDRIGGDWRVHPDFGEGVTVIVARESDAAIDGAGDRRVRRTAGDIRSAEARAVRRRTPRNTMGKMQKNLLREKPAALYSAGSLPVAQKPLCLLVF